MTPQVRAKVLERDGWKCVFCGRTDTLQMAHYIPRSLGGLGIEENLVTLCLECHMKSHNEWFRELDQFMEQYLNERYPNITNDERKYRK